MQCEGRIYSLLLDLAREALLFSSDKGKIAEQYELTCKLCAAATWVTRCENNTNFHYAMAKGRLVSPDWNAWAAMHSTVLADMNACLLCNCMQPLYSYLHGSNKQSRSLPSSAPLAVRITPNQSFSGEPNSTWSLTKNFTLAMFLANETMVRTTESGHAPLCGNCAAIAWCSSNVS